MLIVKRETDESLEFEVGGITVTTRFLRVDGRRVTIGIDAPRDVRVLPNRKGSDVGVTQDKKTATEE